MVLWRPEALDCRAPSGPPCYPGSGSPLRAQGVEGGVEALRPVAVPAEEPPELPSIDMCVYIYIYRERERYKEIYIHIYICIYRDNYIYI